MAAASSARWRSPRDGCHGLALKADLAEGELQQPGHAAQQRGLAHTVGIDDRDVLAGANRERDAAQHRGGVPTLPHEGEIADGYGRIATIAIERFA